MLQISLRKENCDGKINDRSICKDNYNISER